MICIGCKVAALQMVVVVVVVVVVVQADAREQSTKKPHPALRQDGDFL